MASSLTEAEGLAIYLFRAWCIFCNENFNNVGQLPCCKPSLGHLAISSMIQMLKALGSIFNETTRGHWKTLPLQTNAEDTATSPVQTEADCIGKLL